MRWETNHEAKAMVGTAQINWLSRKKIVLLVRGGMIPPLGIRTLFIWAWLVPTFTQPSLIIDPRTWKLVTDITIDFGWSGRMGGIKWPIWGHSQRTLLLVSSFLHSRHGGQSLSCGPNLFGELFRDDALVLKHTRRRPSYDLWTHVPSTLKS